MNVMIRIQYQFYNIHAVPYNNIPLYFEFQKLQKNAQTSAKMHEKQRKIKFSISGRFVCLSDSTTKVVLHRTDMPESGGDSKRKQTTQSATTPTPTSAGDSAAEESKRKSKPANVLSNFVHRVVAFFVRSR